MIRSQVLGIGSYVPERVVSNDELCYLNDQHVRQDSKQMETSDEWIQQRTGIRERRFVPNDGSLATTDLALRASRGALEVAGVEARELDCIIFATLSPDIMFPGSGVILQDKLGIAGEGKGRAAACYDIRQQCSGFLYGLQMADALVKAGLYKRILVVGAELHSHSLDYTTRGRDVSILFGDGAGAIVLVGDEDPRPASDPGARGILATYLAADGSHTGSLNILGGGTQHPPSTESIAANRHVLRMDGRAVFGLAVRAMSDACERVLAAASFPADSVDFVLPHQANLRIIDAIVRRLSLAPERVLVNLDRYGNTSSASIPIALDEAVRDGRIRTGSTILSCGMGAGLTWGAALIRW